MKKTVALIINPYISDFKLYDEWMHPVGLYFLYDFFEKTGIIPYFFNFLDPGSHVQQKKFGTGTFESTEIEKPPAYQSIKRKYKLYGRSPQSFTSFLGTISKPDIVCIGGTMTYWAPGIIETYKLVLECIPDSIIVCGGIAAQLIPSYLGQRMPRCHIAGDITGLMSLSNHFPFFQNHNINQRSLSIKSCLSQYRSLQHAPVLLSLGCPMRCSYCASSVLQPHHYLRSVDTVIDEMVYAIEKFNIADFAFYDDALLLKKEEHLFPFLERLGDLGRKVRFHTPNGLHVRYIDGQILDKMLLSGFKTLRFGYESGLLHHRKAVFYKVNGDQLQEKIKLALMSGFTGDQIGVYVMGGLPDQTPDELSEEMDFINALGVTVKPVFISPVPGTGVFAQYSTRFPQIQTDPLWHNDTFFITNLENWDEATLESIRQKAKILNSSMH
jgi:hypothetical protein